MKMLWKCGGRSTSHKINDDVQKLLGWMFWVSTAVGWSGKKKKKTIEGDWGEPGNDSSTIKSDFSLELKYGEWMNSRTYLDLVRLCPYYRKFGVGLLVRCY